MGDGTEGQQERSRAGRGGEPVTLSVVVPAHDEEAGIAWAVEALVAGVSDARALGLVSGGEIVVVDDHSSDGTAAVVAALADRWDIAVRLVAATGPQGLGTAVRTGLAAAEGDLVLYTDADLPFDPGDIPRLIRPLERYRADVVCGYRFDRTSEGIRRAVQSHAYNALVRATLPVTARDVNFACKLLRRDALDRVLPDLVSTGSFIDVELLARIAHHDLHLVQVGVDYFPRHGSSSTLGGADAILGILRDARSLAGGLRSGR